MPLNLPHPPNGYSRDWMNQYTRVLELDNLDMFTQLQALRRGIFPSYTTTNKNLLTNMAGQVIFDTDLGKLCVNTGSGWETITSVP